MGSVLVVQWLAFPTLNPEDMGSYPTEGRQLVTTVLHIAQSLPLSPFHCLDMTQIMLKDVKHQILITSIIIIIITGFKASDQGLHCLQMV